ncbi:endolysin [Xanthomonas phage vB_Xar_IVIA-DoCa7]|uniref:Endolysin n=1 Tax=Xanthomonas phage vB_Xar_IVIA-DoCa7 TaxID=2975534 RepID=A0A9X9NYW9_9CAUD|nr:endolysin [Xanthomonas phage vB_Xar_IVIA-DoCa7]
MGLKAKLAALAAASLLSMAGLLHIMDSEGLRLKAYADPATGGAPWTICWGHTGPEVYPGLVVTRDQCEVWLREDTLKAEAIVKKAIKRPIRQGEYDAMVSFTFNVGGGNLRSSTLLRKFNQGDRVGSCHQYPHWKYANKMILEGLVTRRFKERDMCLLKGPYIYDPNL